MSILVGTASWTDKTLIECGEFYPQGCKNAEARLRYYSSIFPIVEVDSSYYAMPSTSNGALWVERTPAGFVFDMKAFRLFTGHQTEPKFFPKDLQVELPRTDKKNLYYKDVPAPVIEELWARFFAALQPLHTAGKLGSVLFQFPHWVTAVPKARAHVEHCADRMQPFLTAFEFRHESWLNERNRESTLAMERERGIVHVIVDAPEGVVKRAHTVWEVTSPKLAIVRLHGRNAETWSGAESAAERFQYEYNDEELEEIAALVRSIATRVARTHVLFNNCFRDVAQRNAHTMMSILAGEASGPWAG
ncbi:DUF72 domain-containing protein [Burkholderia multivorans]|uniref:DUF72 domain-containing protein n=1 Tax=Burkholderia multivorans TaxID=87883 RepID=UPI0021BF90D6|nr:DUF72 domain-containing protein [Burkholderia multivorans]MDR8761991.1 hypothetical protein [Burkholderia multivorans]MDR8766208.1 hypothetical protein [Burkholderia multivorans]MDR8770005.1 hypothetical protein [Burkholderia multivorans]MDR8792040.1 hypothetical protein [Burkholderia multivorans]MDR8794559.1 hypothetical protein [Burkholderia multivorans]